MSLVRVKSDDGKTYYAQLDGKVEYRNYDLNVSNVYSVSGDLDIGTGSIDFNGDVTISGGVHSGVTVHAMGNIFIGGYVEDAILKAGKDISSRMALMQERTDLLKQKAMYQQDFLRMQRL